MSFQDDLIPAPALEKMLLRKLDATERDYLMTINAKRVEEKIEPLAVQLAAELELNRLEKEIGEVVLEKKVEVKEVHVVKPLPSDTISKIKGIMGSISLKAPSWASFVSDDDIRQQALNLLPDSNNNTFSSCKKEAEAKYLPWICNSCSFCNYSFPSICEICEIANPLYVPLYLNSSDNSSNTETISDSYSQSTLENLESSIRNHFLPTSISLDRTTLKTMALLHKPAPKPNMKNTKVGTTSVMDVKIKPAENIQVPAVKPAKKN